MKKARKLLVSLLSTACAVSFLPFVVNADAFYEGNLNYTITSSGSSQTVRIDGYRTAPASGAALTIPDTVTHNGVTYRVTAIKDYAFKDVDTITSVKIGKYVSSIGFQAFYDCDGITTINHNSNTVLTQLSNECFRSCGSLRTVTLPTSITLINGNLGGGSFEACTSLTTVNFSQLTNLEEIGRSAFSGCTSLTGLNLPDSIVTICDFAFYDCDSITTVNIPNSLTSLGYEAFYDCDGLLNVISGSSCVLTELANECFRNCDSLTTVSLPVSLKLINGSIGGGSFEGCSNLTNVNFSQLTNLEEIGRSAFNECTSLTGLILPDSLKTIRDFAFYNCDSITSVNIPDSLTTLGYMVFYDCDGLVSITSGDSCVLTEFGNECFRDCDSLTTVALPTSLTSISGSFGGGSFENCRSLTTVNFEQLTNLERIERAAFYNCTSLSRIKLPASVTYIGPLAFDNCEQLDTVQILAAEAPQVAGDSFESDIVTVYVPVGSTGYQDNEWMNYNVVYGNPPAPTSAPTSAPTTTTTPTPAPSSGTPSEAGASGFVERLYTVALGRSSDPNGQAAWVSTLTSGENTGADVARGFLYSPEFLNRDVSNEEFVRVLYRTFFDREADEGGLNGWVNELANGKSKEHVIEGFINSTEWANLCLSYGIPSGGTGTPSIEVEPNQQTIDFCTRLYTTCLNREADQNGLMAWARQLANQRDSGSGAARGFFFSAEFTNQNVSNGEYVIRLYRTFMGREPDQSGYDAWVAQLNEGVSRDVVFEGFAQSPEFTRICASYGIVR